MKKSNLISIFLILVLAGLVSVSLLFSQGKTFTTNLFTSTNDSKEIVTAVEGFWSAALAGDENKINEYVTITPNSFLKTCEDEEQVKVKFKSESGSGSSILVGYGMGLSSNFIEQNQDTLLWLTEKIKKEQYKLFRVIEDKREGPEAMVSVTYGTDKTSAKATTLLLYKEDGKWRIFTNTSKWELASYNNYYAEKSKCSQSQ
jgi:hypothetical protein